MLADPDPPVAQLGAVFLARLAIWRRDHDRLDHALEILAPRAANEATDLIQAIHTWREGKPFHHERQRSVVETQTVSDRVAPADGGGSNARRTAHRRDRDAARRE